MKKTKYLITTIIIMAIITLGGNSTFANSFNHNQLKDVKVYINGTQFETKESFYNFNNSTFIPIRAFFEELGAEIIWKEDIQTVLANIDGKSIELNTKENIAKVDEEDEVVDVESKIINSTTYVPLRFIAESFNYSVNWDSRNLIISIMDTEILKEEQESKTYESSSNYKKDYIEMEIIDNSKLSVKGRTDLDKTDYLIWVESKGKQSMIKEYRNVKSNNIYDDTISLRNLNEGEYRLGIYFKQKYDSMYQGYYWDIPIDYKDGEIFFPVSPIYENNHIQYMSNSVIDSERYLDIRVKDEFERKQIENLAYEITKDSKSDYNKLLSINNWVSQNIYYNWDGYKIGEYGRTDAYGTLESKKSVCQGYAELTEALLRSVKIPARIVSGHALGVSAKGGHWNDVDHTKSNHAWNEAYVDGRWIILDTTWNSNNKYENGQFNKSTMNYKYFDPDLQIFSYTHKIMNVN